jgi:Heterokaryon incompatibility protein (HET)
MSASRSYTYIPLRHDEIRVLRYRRASNDAGSATGPIIINGPISIALNHEIEIDHVCLQDTTPFLALSYVWGIPSRNFQLTLCDGSLMPITESIAEALPHVLRDVEDGRIWIDQICINQSDIEERNEQLIRMGDIYRNASRVIVWLGPEGDGAERVDRVFQDFENTGVGSADDTTLREAFIYSPEAHINRQAMISVMKLPWFERAWVVQEFTIAREAILVHGTFRWDPDTMFLVTCQFRDLGRESFCGFLRSETSYLRRNHPFQVMRNVKMIPEAFYSLLSRMTGLCKASEERDLVYAFLSLNRDHRIQIRPDYALPVDRVFIGVAKTIIAATGNLDILAVVPRQPHHGSQISIEFPADFPSWVPNWCYSPSSMPLFYRAGRVPFEACPGWSWVEPNLDPNNPNRLELRGRIIGHVHTTSPVLSGTGSRQSLRSFVKLDEQIAALSQILQRVTSRDILTRQRVLRICISDGSFVPHLSEPTVQQDIEFRDPVALSEDNLLSLLRVYDNEGDFNPWDREKWLLREYLLVLQNRRLFISEDGRLGLAQNTLRTGDTIIIAHGSATPLIIRATDKSHQAFHFIGQCYLENAMFGEECDFENWPISTFTIM